MGKRVVSRSRGLSVLYFICSLAPTLCADQAVFTVSSLSYSPGTAESDSTVSLTFAPSHDIIPVAGDAYSLVLHFPPSFAPVGQAPTYEACESMYSRFGESVVTQCSSGYSADYDRLLSVERVEPDEGRLSRLVVYIGDPASPFRGSVYIPLVSGLLAGLPIRIVFCCMHLPPSLEANSASVSMSLHPAISAAPIMWSPRILAASDWLDLRLTFNPPAARTVAALLFTVQPAQALPAGAFLDFSLGSVELVSGVPNPMELEFTFTAQSGTLLGYYAQYLVEERILRFTITSTWLREEVVEIRVPHLFLLPASLEANDMALSATVLAADAETVLVASTPFFESEAVLPVHVFLVSEFSLSGELKFSLNRDLEVGYRLCLRLPGWTPAATPVPLSGSTAFENAEAIWDADWQDLWLTVTEPLLFDGSGADVKTITFRGLTPPVGQYENDPSLRIGVLDEVTQLARESLVPVLVSPQIGAEKQFTASSLMYEPNVPGAVAKISIEFEPSVALTSGTLMNVHLRGGFQRVIPGSSVVVSGPSADIFESSAVWWPGESRLAFQVAVGQEVTGRVQVWVPASQGFSLPLVLSENDEILLLETSAGVIIRPEPIKLSPKVGDSAKHITDSAITFNPTIPNGAADVMIEFEANTDLLPGADIVLHLGGFAASAGSLGLTGTHSPSFVAQSGEWNGDSQDLTMRLGVAITAGTRAEVTISGLTLPNALRANDRSLWLSVPNMGIPGAQFFSASDRINNQVVKKLSGSELRYTGDSAVVPDTVSGFRIDFASTVDLLKGAVIYAELPGFRYPEIWARPVITAIPPLVISAASWDNLLQVLAVTVVSCPKEQTVGITVGPQLLVPSSLALNDPGLKLGVRGGMWIPAEQIRDSPAIVAREFTVSALSFAPKRPLSTINLTLTLQASIGLAVGAEVVVVLPEFRRVDPAAEIDISAHRNGTGRQIELGTVTWSEPDSTLSIQLADSVPADTAFLITVSESSGIILPSVLNENDPSLTVAVVGAILASPIRESPLVGDGPTGTQNFCVYQFDSAPRTKTGSADCECPDADPCVASDLISCGCSATRLDVSSDPLPAFSVSGFNLRSSDSLFFVTGAAGGNCRADHVKGAFQLIGMPSASVSGLTFPGVRAVIPGHYGVCLRHMDLNFFVGTVTVRPKCSKPLVGLNGACFTHCPAGTLPEAGSCRLLAKKPLLNSPLAFKVALIYANADSSGLVTLQATDSSRRYFEFRLGESLGSVLGESPSRFVVAGLSRGDTVSRRELDTVVATIVVKPAALEAERSSEELVTLWSALASDRNSIVYDDEFLKHLVTEGAATGFTEVKECAGGYRPVCPSPLKGGDWHGYAVGFGGLFTGLGLIGVVLSLYRLDAGPTVRNRHLLVKKEPEKITEAFHAKMNNFSVIKVPASVDRELTGDPVDMQELDEVSQRQLAADWLDGKLMHDEPLVLKRRTRPPL